MFQKALGLNYEARVQHVEQQHREGCERPGRGRKKNSTISDQPRSRRVMILGSCCNKIPVPG